MYQPPPGKCLLRIKVAERDLDYIELELEPEDLTYERFVRRCCQELDIEQNQIYRIRKAPMVRVRSSADVARFAIFESIEFVLNHVGDVAHVGNGVNHDGVHQVV